MKNFISDRNRVRVQIFGREYEMDPGDLTPLEVQSVAAFVDERMREISESLGIADTQKVAVLAAINIALDYLQLQEQKGTPQDETTPKIEHLTHILDQALQN